MRFLFAIVILSGTFAFLGGRDLWLASKASIEPDKLTAAQLIARGADGNPHVEISEFFIGDNFVYQEEAGRWKTVWLPVGPVEDVDQPMTTVKAVIKSYKAKSDADIMSLAATPALRGMVMNHIQSLGGDEKRILTESYPGTNAKDVLIFEVGKDPAQMKKLGGTFLGLGIVGLLVSAGIGIVVIRRN